MPPPGNAIITNVPVTLNAAGSAPLIAGPFNYRNGDRAYLMTIQRATTADPTPFPDSNTEIRVSVEGRIGNSGPFIFLAGFTTTGGIVLDEHGEEEAENLFVFEIPENSPLAGQNNRRVRVIFETLHDPAPTLILSVSSL